MIDQNDVIALIGIILIAVGLWFVYWPLAIIVPGIILFVVGVMGAKNKSSDDRPPEE